MNSWSMQAMCTKSLEIDGNEVPESLRGSSATFVRSSLTPQDLLSHFTGTSRRQIGEVERAGPFPEDALSLVRFARYTVN
jgi:hypothetical protein